jgi:hypothetical protein
MVAALGADQGCAVFTVDFPGAYLNPEMKEIVQDFRIRYLEEQQQDKIKALENKIMQLQMD